MYTYYVYYYHYYYHYHYHYYHHFHIIISKTITFHIHTHINKPSSVFTQVQDEPATCVLLPLAISCMETSLNCHSSYKEGRCRGEWLKFARGGAGGMKRGLGREIQRAVWSLLAPNY